MTKVLHALLDTVSNSSERAAISAGWEIGADLGRQVRADDTMRKEIDKAARLVGRDMKLNRDLIHGAALLALALKEE